MEEEIKGQQRAQFLDSWLVEVMVMVLVHRRKQVIHICVNIVEQAYLNSRKTRNKLHRTADILCLSTKI